VRVHTAGSLEGVAFIAYELVEGCSTLEDLLARGALDLDGRVRLIVEVARAVGFAHARGVLHRDVKPANVLVDAAGRARVADFGLATATGLERLTMTGAIVGTPTYMAPEQITGGVASPATDVWALGVMLYEALAGAPPFAAGSLAELAVRICTQRPPRAPGLPAALEAVCLRALDSAPGARHADALAFADDLERARAAPSSRGRPAMVALVTGALLAGAVGLGAWVTASEPAPPPQAPLAQAPRPVIRAAPTVEASRLSRWLSSRLEPSQRGAVHDHIRREPLAEVQRALDELEREPAAAPLPALRCAAWLREARGDLAPVEVARGRLVFARWIAEARLARPDAARELDALADVYWSSAPTTIPELTALSRLGEALGAALLLGGSSPYDVEDGLDRPLLDLVELVAGDAPTGVREHLRDDLTARAPSEPLLVTVWLHLSNRREVRSPIGLDDAAWAAHRRLLAVMPAAPPARGWGRVHGELVARLRWRTHANDPGFVLREAARAQAGAFVLRLAADTAVTLSQQELDHDSALEYARQAWAMLERVPADDRDPLYERLRERVKAVALLRAPAWFVELPAERRPHPVLPPGVSWGERPGEYLRASDGAVLGWVDDGWREVR
jgi:hypothetical protein